MKTFYITTPLYYVNAKPHIGHAYTNILCDTFARWHKFRGEKVFFLTGTDEHGTKIEKAAREQGREPRQYVEEMVPKFKELWRVLGIEYDHFIRTTDDEHKRIVQDILRDLEVKGEIYKASYKGWYCTPCESFWMERQLAEGKCPDCKRDVQQLSEENYFFKMSAYQKDLIRYLEENKDFIRPEMRRNEILGFLREPLEDLCITRPQARLSWGIDYPGSRDHVVYVWFDALINYLSIARYQSIKKKFPNLWPADLHIVGKDILRHHAVYWPIMLMACGYELPKTIVAHGWWTMAGAKVSKSRGNVVDPVELVKKYGVDAFRYFLLHEVTVGNDGAFSEDLLAERYTTNLANDLGNLWFRVVTMLHKYREGKVPTYSYKPGIFFDVVKSRMQTYKYLTKNPEITGETDLNTYRNVLKEMNSYNPAGALNAVWNPIIDANGEIERRKPWNLAKDQTKEEELSNVLGNLIEQMAHIAVLLLPFLPETAKKILTRLKLPTEWVVKEEREFERPLLKQGVAVERGDALFPRLDEEKVKT